ncbi:MAG: lipid-A-disaccharide synthase [Geobacter sp.]|nr:lipid-A-disaccharide synthase [Geobacter sp.]
MTNVEILPLSLPPPQGGVADILFIAAEHSGDQHAARAVRELRALRPGVRVCALGGPALSASGAQLLQDLMTSSAIGFQTIRRLSFYRRLIADIVRWVGEHQPRAVCFVDSSGLNLRIAKALFARGITAKAGGPTKALYFIGPQIWASRAGRRFQMARHIDGLAVIFPFEPKCYADTKLPVQFVGHPLVVGGEASPVVYDPDGPILLLPGSRRQAVALIFPVLLDGYLQYRRDGGDREAVVVYPSDEVRTVIEETVHTPYRLVRAGEIVAASAVLTSSGTMSLCCALAGIPGAIVYRTDLITYIIGRLLVKVPYLGIANLLLGETIYPEYIQNASSSVRLAAQLNASVGDSKRIAKTRTQAERLQILLSKPAHGSVGEWLNGYLSSA